MQELISVGHKFCFCPGRGALLKVKHGCQFLYSQTLQNEMVLLTKVRCLLLCKGSSEYTKKFLAMFYNKEETNVMAHNTYEVKFIL